MKTKQILLLGGSYASVFIGVGVASGQEIMQYFTNHGLISYLAILLYLLVSFWMCASVMGLARLNPEARTYRFYLGDKLGMVFDKGVMPILAFLMMGVLLAGAGTIAVNYFGLSPWIGVGLMSVMLFVTYIGGIQKIIDILGVTGPVIVVIAIVVCLLTISRGGDFSRVGELIQSNESAYVISGHWWWGAIQYAVFVPGICLIFMGEMGSNASSYKVAIGGALVGNVLILASMVAMNSAFLSNYSSIAGSSIPTLDLAATLSPTFATIYGVVIFLALYTTVMPHYWLVCKTMPTSKNKKSNIIFAICLSVICLFAGQLPFDRALNVVYPFVGYTCTVVAVFVLVGLVRYLRKNKGLKAESTADVAN